MLSNVPLFRIGDAQLLVFHGVLWLMFINVNVYQFWGLCSVILSIYKEVRIGPLGLCDSLALNHKDSFRIVLGRDKNQRGKKKRRKSLELSCSVSFFRFLFSGRLLPQPVFAGKGAKPVGSWQSWYQSSGRVLKCILTFSAVLKGNPQSYKLQALWHFQQAWHSFRSNKSRLRLCEISID